MQNDRRPLNFHLNCQSKPICTNLCRAAHELISKLIELCLDRGQRRKETEPRRKDDSTVVSDTLHLNDDDIIISHCAARIPEQRY